MKWIKASERLPVLYASVNAKKNNLIGMLYVEDERFVIFSWFGGTDSHTVKSENLSSIEWLDESPAHADGWVSEGVRLIADERERQVKVEKWDYTHDADYKQGEMIGAAACYAANALNKNNPGFMRVQIHLPAETNIEASNTGDRGDRQLRKAGWYDAWPWGKEWDKRDKHDIKRSLVIAGALIAAELDRLKAITPTP